MTDYTPTTAEMRVFYTAERLDGPHVEGFRLPTVDQAEAEFDRWLAARDAEKRAEWEAELGWEYGLLNPQAPDGGKLQGGAHLISDNREHIEKQQRRGHPVIQAVMRLKAGLWVPVEQAGETGATKSTNHEIERQS